jgi:hypothetical protein
MQAKGAAGSFRVLWLGDPRSLNQGSWSAGDGLAYATSEHGSPDARWLWNAAGPGPTSGLASAVDLARSDRTDQLGSMLAPAGVRYVVLLTSVAPEISGEQSPQQYPVPSDVAPALGRQLDLIPVIAGTGITVYDNAAWIPERAEVAGGVTPAKTTSPDVLAAAPGSKIVPGAQPVLPGPAASRVYRGPLSKGTVLTALAPAGSWSLIAPSGVPAPRAASFGWAGSYRVDAAGSGTLRFEGGLLVPLSGLLSIAGWLLAAAALIGRRRHRLSWHPSAGGRRRVGADEPSAPEDGRGEGGTPVAEVVP